MPTIDPELLRPAAEFGSKFNPANPEQRLRYSNDRASYALALQQQQAEHQAQRINTNKAAHDIYVAQQRLELERLRAASQIARNQLAVAKEKAQTEHEMGFANRLTEAATNPETAYGTPGYYKAVKDAQNLYPLGASKHASDISDANRFFQPPTDLDQARLQQIQSTLNAPETVPTSVIVDYAKNQGVLQFHRTAIAEHVKNQIAAGTSTPYDKIPDMQLAAKQAAIFEAKYPQLKTLLAPQTVSPATASTAPATAATPSPTATPAQTPVSFPLPTPPDPSDPAYRERGTGAPIPHTALINPGKTEIRLYPTENVKGLLSEGYTFLPEDQRAIDWAKNNPDDPRSKQINQLHGIEE